MIEVAVFLRGINVSGYRKVPMADLKLLLSSMGYKKVRTWLNSGNAMLICEEQNLPDLEARLAQELELKFGFSIPVIAIPLDLLLESIRLFPFENQPSGKDIRHYVSFLKHLPTEWLAPWSTDDDAFRVIDVREKMVFSVLDLSKKQTTQGMDLLEIRYGKQITTRNWNTILRMTAQ